MKRKIDLSGFYPEYLEITNITQQIWNYVVVLRRHAEHSLRPRSHVVK